MDILTIPPQDFKPLRLCLDDVLPVSMVLLLGYGRRLDPKALHAGLRTALQAFPHLGARMSLNLQPLSAELVPGDRDVRIEWIRDGHPLPNPRSLESLDQDTLFARYAPSAAAEARTPMQALQAPLFQARLIWAVDGEACVLGLMVSHMAMDGSGLGLFLAHLAAALHGGTGPEVIHDRMRTFPDTFPQAADLPAHYREVPHLSMAMAQEDPVAASPATVFSVPLLSLQDHLGRKSAGDARLYLAAHLCQEVAALQPRRKTLALWCNTRGIGHVPRNYTGNAGCYAHMPLEAGDAEGCYRNLQRTITRGGFAGISDTYARLKAAEAAGRYVFWNGPGDDLLSLNLVPHARGAADFGQGGPEYAQLLTRNVSGLRLYGTPDGERFVVEASLPGGHGAGLMAYCARLGLSAQPWHQRTTA